MPAVEIFERISGRPGRPLRRIATGSLGGQFLIAGVVSFTKAAMGSEFAKL
jgi:hypothetical protein